MPRHVKAIAIAVAVILLVGEGACSPSASGARGAKPWRRHVVDNSSRGPDGVRLADVDGDGRMDIVTGWEEGAITRIMINPGPGSVKGKWIGVTVGSTPNVEDALLVDIDGDGFADVITCCEGSTRTMFVHWSRADPSEFLKPAGWQTVPIPASKDLMAWMFSCPLSQAGGRLRALAAGGKGEKAKVGLWLVPPNPRDLPGWRFIPLRDSGWIMSLICADMNNDSLPDILLSDRKGSTTGVYWLENPGRPDVPWKEHLVGGAGREVMFISRVDLDGDDLPDVIAGVKPREVLWLRSLDRTGLTWETHPIAMPNWAGTAKAVAAGDIDGDGRPDIVFTCEDAKDLSGVGWLKQPQKTGDPWEANDISGKEGSKYDLVELIDLDDDGDLDVLTCEERELNAVIWYENPRN